MYLGDLADTLDAARGAAFEKDIRQLTAQFTTAGLFKARCVAVILTRLADGGWSPRRHRHGPLVHHTPDYFERLPVARTALAASATTSGRSAPPPRGPLRLLPCASSLRGSP